MAERPREHFARPLDPWLRRMLYVNAVLAAIAGTDLFFASGVTGRYFAWTIDPPLTAAFLGGAYLSSVVLLFLSGRERTWVDARVGAISAQAFITLLFAAMLIHIDRFHTGTSDAITFFATWSFIGTYVVVPPLTLVAVVRQLRNRQADAPGGARLVPWFRAVLAVQGAAMLTFGAGLVAAPSAVGDAWPWPLTPLTGRAIGAFLAAIGTGVVIGVVDGHTRRLRAAFTAYGVLGALELVSLARYAETVDWKSATTWLYVVFVGGVAASGVLGWLTVRAQLSTDLHRAAAEPAA